MQAPGDSLIISQQLQGSLPTLQQRRLHLQQRQQQASQQDVNCSQPSTPVSHKGILFQQRTVSQPVQQDTGSAEIAVILKELITHACVELKRSLQMYQDENDYNNKIIAEFGIRDDSNILSQVPNAVLMNISDINSTMVAEMEKFERVSHKLFISTIESYLNSYKNAVHSLEEYHTMLLRELKKYELAYIKESQNSNENLLDLTSIQTSVLKLQDDIHQANEQQEHKKTLIKKLSECFAIHDKIKECAEKKQQMADSFKNLRTLPPNLSEAEVRLRLLKQKFKEVCDTFSKEVTMK